MDEYSILCIDLRADEILISATSERPFVPPIAEWRRVSSGLADLQRRAEPPMPAQNTHSGAAPQALLARS
jgi:hypothetical protein